MLQRHYGIGGNVNVAVRLKLAIEITSDPSMNRTMSGCLIVLSFIKQFLAMGTCGGFAFTSNARIETGIPSD
jgi:hypothetical protein